MFPLTHPSATRPHRRRRSATLLVAAVLVCGVVGLSPGASEPAAADPGDIGWEGPSFTGSSGAPSGSKPQSKVWFHDGRWWGDLWDTTTGDHHIHWLDIAAGRWVRTPTVLDGRSDSRSDVLSDGNRLYVASHRFAEGSGSTPTGQPALLRRYSYDATSKTYSLDAGFPVQINDARSETLVIDKDSTGRLWATWTQDRNVMVSVSSAGGQSWGTPFVVPTGDATVASDDISSLVAFSPGRIGVMWSNQDDDTFTFAHRSDSDPAGTWSPAEVAFTGPSYADDHINLASVSEQDGRILAAVKTSRTGSNPLNVLLDRNPWTGRWENHTFGLGSDSHTRPVVAVDKERGVAHMFAPAGQSGGSIYEKTAPLSNLGFGPGRGTPVLTDASSGDINNPTTTKQPVDSTTGLVVLATNDSTRQYWTHFDPLGGAPPPPPEPVASFTASPASGSAPLDVTFSDTSTGSTTSRSWDFGDGTTATSSPVIHRYASVGTYTARLTVTGPDGSSTATRVITVSEAPPPPGPSVTFAAEADAAVRSTSATSNYGAGSTLRTRAGSEEYVSYLRFGVTGLTGPPGSATLRLWVTDGSPDAGVVTATGSDWAERGITWAERPALGAQVGPIGPAVAGSWVEVDVTSAIAGSGPVSLALRGLSSNSALFASREGGPAPQLVITTEGGPPPAPPVASFAASPTSGAAPLDVTFTDTSTGSSQTRLWDFGDGASGVGSPVTHRYTQPGTYTARLTISGPAPATVATRVITVSEAPPPPGPSVTFPAEADAAVKSTSATQNYGTGPTVRTRAGSEVYVSYLRFRVSGLTGAPQSATLRLWVTDASRSGGVVSATGSIWGERTITWAARPPVGPQVGVIASAPVGTWVEVDVSSAVTGNGDVSLALSGSSTDSALYSSREGGSAPQLVVTP